MGVVHGAADVRQVLLEALFELLGAVFLTALGQEIDDMATGLLNPPRTLAVIDKAQHLNALAQALGIGPVVDGAYRGLLTAGDTGGGDLDTVHLEGGEQRLGNVEFLLRGEGDPLGLLAISQGGIKDLDGMGWAGHRASIRNGPDEMGSHLGRWADFT